MTLDYTSPPSLAPVNRPPEQVLLDEWRAASASCVPPAARPMATDADAHGEAAAPTVAQALLGYLKLEGVDTLFGIPGAAVMHLADALRSQRDDFRYLVCRHETGAAFAADGYARVSGTLGVVLVTSGPGATNALTGTMNAQHAGVPLLTITGEVAQGYYGKGFLQEGTDVGLNVEAVYGAASGYSAIVTAPANFATLFTQALRDALGNPPRAAHVSLPDDISGSPLPSTRMPIAARNYRASLRGADAADMARVFVTLQQAQRPLILLGAGCRDALRGGRLAAFTAFVERWAIPVMTTPGAKGVFPESHRLSLRQFGMAYCEWARAYMAPATFDPALRPDYDTLVVLGSSLGGFATNKWDPMLTPRQSLVQVDLDQDVLGRAMPMDFGVVADAGAAIDCLVALGSSATPDAQAVDARNAFVDRVKREVAPHHDAGDRRTDGGLVKPSALMTRLNELLPVGSNVFVDSGNCVGWAMHYLRIDPPSRIFSALCMGAMGFAVGAVVGGKLAAPRTSSIAIVGDGAFLMHGAEVSTAARYRVGALWIVLNDNDLGMVSQGMAHFFPDEKGARADDYALGRPDLAGYARALGADAYDAHSLAQFGDALSTALVAADRGIPQVIVVHIDPTQVPPYYQHLEPPQHPSSASNQRSIR